MPWIKLSDKAPKFDTLIELEVEVSTDTTLSLQAKLLTLSGDGAQFYIFYDDKEGPRKVTIPPDQESYWQEKQPSTKAPKVAVANAGKRNRKPMTDEEKKARSDKMKQKAAEEKAPKMPDTTNQGTRTFMPPNEHP